jgi:hypothetical protein
LRGLILDATTQMFGEEFLGGGGKRRGVLCSPTAMTFIAEEQILNRPAPGLQCGNHPIALGRRDPNVIGALPNHQRRLNLRYNLGR